MKRKILLVIALIVVPYFFMSCTNGDPVAAANRKKKAAEIKKNESLKIFPNGYEDMTEEDVENEKYLEAQEEQQHFTGGDEDAP